MPVELEGLADLVRNKEQSGPRGSDPAFSVCLSQDRASFSSRKQMSPGIGKKERVHPREALVELESLAYLVDCHEHILDKRSIERTGLDSRCNVS
jgi:hypothetical protein